MATTAPSELFRHVFELLDQGVVVLEAGRVVQMNPAMASWLGMDPADARGQDMMEFIEPSAREEMLACLAKGEAAPYPSILRPSDGVPVPVRVRVHEFAEAGKHMQVMAFRDMRPEFERQNRSGLGESAKSEIERLRATDKFKTNLLNTAAHELNTPITPLRLQTHMLTQGTLGPLTPKQQRAVGILDRNVQRISLIVKDVLDVARMDEGNLKLDVRPTDLDSILGDVMESFADTAEQVRIKLIRGGNTGLAVEADPDRLVQVLYNLISNALKFTPADGSISVISRIDDDFVVVDVIDTGVGLSKSQIELLFKPFSQAHDPKDFSATGTGLGLFISRGIVEAHGGTINCASEGPNTGSTFTVRLPKSEADIAERVTATGAPAPAGDRKDAMLERLRELI